MAPTTLFDISADDVADTSDDYYTPRWVFDAAGLVFDMDVSAPMDPTRRTCPARRYLTPIEDGLTQPWNGLVWMNPPFSNLRAWVERFTSHRRGLAFLMPGRKENYWMGQLMRAADAITFISADFTRPDGTSRSIPSMMLLVGCGEPAVEAVIRVAAADKYIGGAYHVRPEASRG